MVQPGPDPDSYPPIDPTEPVPDDPGPLLPDTPETLPPAPVEPMPGPDDPDSVPVSSGLRTSAGELLGLVRGRSVRQFRSR
jgi:hypothetical protein